MIEARNLKLSLTKFRVGCFEKAYLGFHLVRCLLLQEQEDVVTDHLLVSEQGVLVLDSRE